MAALSVLAMVGCGKGGAPDKVAPVAPLEMPKAETTVPEVEAGTSEAVVPPPPAAVQASRAEAPANPAAGEKNPATVLRAVTLAEFQAELARQKGKVVVIDAWASWCVPCREKLPRFIALSREFAEADVVFWGLNLDEEEQEELALEVMRENGASFPNFRVTAEVDEVQTALDFQGIPRYFLFDAESKSIVNSGKIDEVVEKLKELFPKP